MTFDSPNFASSQGITLNKQYPLFILNNSYVHVLKSYFCLLDDFLVYEFLFLVFKF